GSSRSLHASPASRGAQVRNQGVWDAVGDPVREREAELGRPLRGLGPAGGGGVSAGRSGSWTWVAVQEASPSRSPSSVTTSPSSIPARTPSPLSNAAPPARKSGV